MLEENIGEHLHKFEHHWQKLQMKVNSFDLVIKQLSYGKTQKGNSKLGVRLETCRTQVITCYA